METDDYRVVWSDLALDNLQEIVTYVERFNPAAALRLGDRLSQLANGLSFFPNRGKAVSGKMRELSNVWPYIIRYRVTGNVVQIVRVRHGARLQDD